MGIDCGFRDCPVPSLLAGESCSRSFLGAIGYYPHELPDPLQREPVFTRWGTAERQMPVFLCSILSTLHFDPKFSLLRYVLASRPIVITVPALIQLILNSVILVMSLIPSKLSPFSQLRLYHRLGTKLSSPILFGMTSTWCAAPNYSMR